MEWGNFWSSHLPRTLYDIELDAESPNPNDQVSNTMELPLLELRCFFLKIDQDFLNQRSAFFLQGFEKMICGMYLGEIVRRVILRMSKESDVFGPISSRLSEAFILRLSFIRRLLCRLLFCSFLALSWPWVYQTKKCVHPITRIQKFLLHKI